MTEFDIAAESIEAVEAVIVRQAGESERRERQEKQWFALIPGAALWIMAVAFFVWRGYTGNTDNPQLDDWLFMVAVFGVLLICGLVFCYKFTEWIVTDANWRVEAAKREMRQAEEALHLLELARDGAENKRRDLEFKLHMQEQTIKQLREQLSALHRQTKRQQSNINNLKRVVEVMASTTFCPLDSDAHRAAVARYMHECGKSAAEIELALFGYTGGQAYHTVKRLLRGNTTR